MTMINVKASILIPTYNRKDSLERLFESIKKQTFSAFEVVVSDGGSSDGTQELCQRFKKFFPVTFVRQDKTGFANAVNCAIKAACGDIAIRIDDDVVLTKQWLENLIQPFDIYTDIGCVTGPVITPKEFLGNRDVFSFRDKFKDSNMFWHILGKFYNDFLCEGQPLAIGKDFRSGAISFGANFDSCLKLDHIIEIDHPESCNMAFRNDLSKKLGNFDEKFTGTSEYSDTDLVYRMRYQGYKAIFNPKAIIYHYPEKKGFYSMRLDPSHRIINFLRFYRRHFKIRSPDQLFRFYAYLLFLNGYFFYKFLELEDIKQLKSIPATIAGLLKSVN